MRVEAAYRLFSRQTFLRGGWGLTGVDYRVVVDRPYGIFLQFRQNLALLSMICLQDPRNEQRFRCILAVNNQAGRHPPKYSYTLTNA